MNLRGHFNLGSLIVGEVWFKQMLKIKIKIIALAPFLEICNC